MKDILSNRELALREDRHSEIFYNPQELTFIYCDNSIVTLTIRFLFKKNLIYLSTNE